MAWDSNGDIVAQTVQIVDPGPITISGKIDDHSVVVLVCTGAAPASPITIQGKIDNHSNVTLKNLNGDVVIGTVGGTEDKKIDGNSNVEVMAGGSITLGSYIHNSGADFRAHGMITVNGEIDYGATVSQIADGDILVTGQINGNEFDHGPSRVELVSNTGSITINGRIDGKSNVYLTAGQNIGIGSDATLSDDGRKIDGDSFVTAIAGGNITLGSWIRSSHTQVDLAAGGGISIAKDISGGANVRLLSAASPPQITVTGPISDNSTMVTSWPPGALGLAGQSGATISQPASPWVPDPMATLPLTAARGGYWWENWGQTFGYVAPFRVVPRSLEDIVQAVIGKGNADRQDLTPVKAVGGGWSFTDAALPFTTQAEVDQASIMQRGGWQLRDVHNVLEGLPNSGVMAMDLLPEAVTRNFGFSTAYDQTNLRQVTNSGAQLPASGEVRLIDTRSLASSLQCEFEGIRADRRPRPDPSPANREILFHVEAGITIADLQQLLDHQHPRLALRASGGSPGATLAGVLSTATHGGEFRADWPLLVDCVRAVHLVGPGGVQWWIEGDVPVADRGKLADRYPGPPPIRFIGGRGWSHPGLPGLTAQDVLNAVAVSMGTMGVIYSVVLAVVPQFGLRQVVHPTTWPGLLAAAGTTEALLRAGDPTANQAVLTALMDGRINGTGIPNDGSPNTNVYVDLAINPLNADCWVVNRQVTPALPDDSNSPPAGASDFMAAVGHALSGRAADRFSDSTFAGRLFDFLSWATDVADLPNDLAQAGRLMSFVSGLGDMFGGVLAAGNAQAVLNILNAPSHPDRGLPFVGDVLTGFFHALEGTTQGQNADGTTRPGGDADLTGISYKVGAIGWPDTGLPGRGLEIALHPSNAFTFLQTVLFDDVLVNTITGGGNPFIGYVSVRVCPPTQTLMGMQQFSPNSVMIEVVSYRSPEAESVMKEIKAKARTWTTNGLSPLLHWGLENDRDVIDAAFLGSTPLGQPYKAGLTRLDAFRQIRAHLRGAHAPVFDNNFTARLGL